MSWYHQMVSSGQSLASLPGQPDRLGKCSVFSRRRSRVGCAYVDVHVSASFGESARVASSLTVFSRRRRSPQRPINPLGGGIFIRAGPAVVRVRGHRYRGEISLKTRERRALDGVSSPADSGSSGARRPRVDPVPGSPAARRSRAPPGHVDDPGERSAVTDPPARGCDAVRHDASRRDAASAAWRGSRFASLGVGSAGIVSSCGSVNSG